MESHHLFALVDGIGGAEDVASSRYCAERLTRCISRVFSNAPALRGITDANGNLLTEDEAIAAVWSQAMSGGFAMCDQFAQQEEVAGACGALVCAVTRSGVYLASVGRGRAVIGTETDALGKEIACDEASSPHEKTSEAEMQRLGKDLASMSPKRPTRMLGGYLEKRANSAIIGLPDVVRSEHPEGDCRRYVVMGSPGLWTQGPRLPLQHAIEAYRSGRSPADEVLSKCGQKGQDLVVVVLVLPPGLGAEDGPLPPHESLTYSSSN
eukprot:TRINITY_DN20208_c0_g1_i3.p1 TRINITY_DN20208_c0_g1~~TRINITY_DN20208_c0_g1_i3.p1  ORF type:complete len:266 (+),score=55.15 TRINITY_DN20208_c0_g1_i3:185-982(+)